MEPTRERLLELRGQMFEMLQTAQGMAYVSDNADHCGSLDELEEYAELVIHNSYHAWLLSRRFLTIVRRERRRSRQP